MKRSLNILLCFMLALLPCFCFVGCSPRENILKIYNWGEYLDREVISEFESWYKQQTGESVEIQYKEYQLCEDAYNEVFKQKADYDLICPSDYILDKMIRKDLLLPIDKEIVYDGKDINSIINPALVHLLTSFDPKNEYTVPYMWGTFGLMYDINKVSDREDMTSWEALFGDKYANQMYMKNSVRDAYAVANIYNNRENLKKASNNFTDYANVEYRNLIDNIFQDVSETTLSAVESTLKNQRRKVFKYAGDEGKDNLAINADPNVCFGLFWSCDAGYIMSENKDLYYEVPKEGSNVWLDGWAIPKYAKNVKAAQYFLQFLCKTDIAVKNMYYVGSSSPITEASNIYKQEIIDDEEFAKGAKNEKEFKDMFLEMMFPTSKTMDRCSIMRDFGNKSSDITKMWIRVKIEKR